MKHGKRQMVSWSRIRLLATPLDWLATILWADPNTLTTILGNKVITFVGLWEGGRRSHLFSEESLSPLGDFCQQQEGIICVMGDGLLIICAIAAVRKRNFFWCMKVPLATARMGWWNQKLWGRRYLGRKFLLFREGFIPGEELGRSQGFYSSLLFWVLTLKRPFPGIVRKPNSGRRCRVIL